MPNLVAARAAMGTTLAFHMVFAAIGVGLPILLFLAEGIGLWKRDTIWYALARRWSQAFSILFIVGAVSGTALSFEFGLLWPTFMKFATGAVGLPFALEGFAFFTEGVFLGLYLYGWDRLSPMAHWLCTVPLVIGGTASAFFITTVDSWMNSPTGYTAVDGKIVNVSPIGVMLNPFTGSETTHTILASYQVTFFAVAAIYAVTLLRGHRTTYYRRGLILPMAAGTIIAPAQAYIGDLSAKSVAHLQPIKLAAMEGLFHTTAGAPLSILGLANPNTQQVYFTLQIPKLLSFLAFGRFNAVVKGLDAFPHYLWPNTTIVHICFDVMVGTGGLMILLPLWFWLIYWRSHGERIYSPIMLWTVVLTGVMGFFAMETGWMVTEIGRQPWTIYNVMTTAEAVTQVPGAGLTFLIVFVSIYVLLAIALVVLLLRLSRQVMRARPRGPETPTTAGTPAPDLPSPEPVAR